MAHNYSIINSTVSYVLSHSSPISPSQLFLKFLSLESPWARAKVVSVYPFQVVGWTLNTVKVFHHYGSSPSSLSRWEPFSTPTFLVNSECSISAFESTPTASRTAPSLSSSPQWQDSDRASDWTLIEPPDWTPIEPQTELMTDFVVLYLYPNLADRFHHTWKRWRLYCAVITIYNNKIVLESGYFE